MDFHTIVLNLEVMVETFKVSSLGFSPEKSQVSVISNIWRILIAKNMPESTAHIPTLYYLQLHESTWFFHTKVFGVINNKTPNHQVVVVLQHVTCKITFILHTA